MKIKIAAIALLALAFSSTTFAAGGGNGIDMALLNDNPNPGVGDRLALQPQNSSQCWYHAIVKTPTVAVIDREICPDGQRTKVTMIVPLDEVKTSESGQKWYRAYEEGPKPLAVSFMSQFYDVAPQSVDVAIIEQTEFTAKLAAKAAGHICTFDAAKLPEDSYRKHGWAASSMNCGGT
jgi:hypothetical protein